AQARLAERARRLPERGRHLHRLHDARLPRQVHALHGRAARREALDHRERAVRRRHAHPAAHHREADRRRARRAQAAPRADHRLPAQLVRGSDMPTTAKPDKTGRDGEAANLTEMAWDPITRIVGSLGIYTKIDFSNRRVAECYSTSSI